MLKPGLLALTFVAVLTIAISFKPARRAENADFNRLSARSAALGAHLLRHPDDTAAAAEYRHVNGLLRDLAGPCPRSKDR